MTIDRHHPLTGWAVFSGTNGDDPTLLGYFPVRAHAEAFLAHAELCDPVIVPACLGYTEILTAEAPDDAGMRALDREIMIPPWAMVRWREEAR